jgi:hypothetical protein
MNEQRDYYDELASRKEMLTTVALSWVIGTVAFIGIKLWGWPVWLLFALSWGLPAVCILPFGIRAAVRERRQEREEAEMHRLPSPPPGRAAA